MKYYATERDEDELYLKHVEIIKTEGRLQQVFYKENYKLGIIEQQELLI